MYLLSFFYNSNTVLTFTKVALLVVKSLIKKKKKIATLISSCESAGFLTNYLK